MRLWIAGIFLFIFACQALPVAALGRHYVKAQVSVSDDVAGEEDGDPIPGDSKVKKESSFPDEAVVHVYGEASVLCSARAVRLIALHRPDQLPVLYAGEITSPPPDFC